jgi:hypothetical protein
MPEWKIGAYIEFRNYSTLDSRWKLASMLERLRLFASGAISSSGYTICNSTMRLTPTSS